MSSFMHSIFYFYDGTNMVLNDFSAKGKRTPKKNPKYIQEDVEDKEDSDVSDPESAKESKGDGRYPFCFIRNTKYVFEP